MLYAIGEILLSLCIAVLLGFALGWLLKGMLQGRKIESAWQRECDRHRTQADRLQTRLNECISEREQLQAEASKRVEKLSTVEALDTQTPVLDKASARKQVADIAARTASGKAPKDDDLKQIRGIGPVLEKLLKGMEIISFRQIANFTEEDIRIIAAALGSFPGRIERDNWRQSARELHEKKYNASP